MAAATTSLAELVIHLWSIAKKALCFLSCSCKVDLSQRFGHLIRLAVLAHSSPALAIRTSTLRNLANALKTNMCTPRHYTYNTSTLTAFRCDKLQCRCFPIVVSRPAVPSRASALLPKLLPFIPVRTKIKGNRAMSRWRKEEIEKRQRFKERGLRFPKSMKPGRRKANIASQTTEEKSRQKSEKATQTGKEKKKKVNNKEWEPKKKRNRPR